MGVLAAALGSGANYGVYSQAFNGTTNYAGYFAGLLYASSTSFPSDRKFKDNLAPVENALDKVLKLNGKTYNYKTEEYKDMALPEGKQFGLVAQEVEQVFPELVKDITPPPHSDPPIQGSKGKLATEPTSTEPRETFKSVNYIELIPVLVEAIKEQQKTIDELKAEVEGLKK